MTEHAFAILLASSFTFGCAAIHAWKDHAAALTAPLLATLLCLSILVGSVTVVKHGGRSESGASVQGFRQASR